MYFFLPIFAMYFYLFFFSELEFNWLKIIPSAEFSTGHAKN